MRNRLIIATAALLLASAVSAAAQTFPAPVAPQAPKGTSDFTTWVGSLDFGFRGTDTDGDEARYERYGDLRNGAATRLLFGRKTDTFFFDGGAENIGYRDQRYFGNYNSGTVRVNVAWDSLPLNYGYMTATPWVDTSSGSTAKFTLDPGTRNLVQTRAVMGIPTNAAQLNSASVYRGLAHTFDLQQRRDTAAFTTEVDASENLSLNLSFTTAKKTGNMPWAGAFAFSNANELPLPLDNRTNDFSAGLEWTAPKGMVRAGWSGSWFNNTYSELVWDNPIRETDYNRGSPPYYDASGYSNGNGPAQGRMSLAPDNNVNVFSLMGMYKLPYRSTFTTSFAYTIGKQNETLIPWTINSVINSQSVLANFHGLQGLPRATADAEVRGTNLTFNFTSRPTRMFSYNLRYRFNDRDNRTPLFDAVEYVRFDAVPEETGGETVPYSIRHNVVEASATVTLPARSALRFGYSVDAMTRPTAEDDPLHRPQRGFAGLTDNSLRVSFDTLTSQYVMVRGQYEFTRRSGSNFNEEWFIESSTQPAARLYDDAERDRNRASLMLVVTPTSMVDFVGSLAYGRDEYNGEHQEFGLIDNDNVSLNFGVNITPIDQVAFGVNVGRDKYASLQRSRNGSPGPTYTDPAYDWDLDNEETINSFDVYFDLLRAIRNTDIRLSYDFSDSDNAFTFGGPRVATMTALGTFLPLPEVTNNWRRFRADVRYFFDERVGVGLGYWYEKFDVSDFATVDLPGSPGTPRIDYLGEIYTGYGNRPYKGNTGFLRLLYVF